MSRLALGVDVGNAKIKIAVGAPGGPVEVSVHLPPYNARRGYGRHDDFARGIPDAIDAALRERDRARVAVAALVTSAGYAYPTYAEGARHVCGVLAEALPDAECFALSGALTLVPAGEVASAGPEVVGTLPFTNATGAVHLARRAVALGDPPRGLVLDTGGQTTGIAILAGEQVDPAALADPSAWLDHRLRNGKLAWIGAETTPLEALLREAAVGDRRYPVIPRGVPFRNVSLLCELVPARELSRLSFFGVLPGRAMALRAVADAVNLDPEMATEDELLGVARQMADAAIDRLAEAIERARATAPPGCADRAIAFGLGAPGLARRALLRAGLAEERITVAHDLLPARLADEASCYGACHAALEHLAGRPLPVPLPEHAAA